MIPVLQPNIWDILDHGIPRSTGDVQGEIERNWRVDDADQTVLLRHHHLLLEALRRLLSCGIRGLAEVLILQSLSTRLSKGRICRCRGT